jgi:hypothetical protein
MRLSWGREHRRAAARVILTGRRATAAPALAEPPFPVPTEDCGQRQDVEQRNGHKVTTPPAAPAALRKLSNTTLILVHTRPDIPGHYRSRTAWSSR